MHINGDTMDIYPYLPQKMEINVVENPTSRPMILMISL